MPVASFLSSEKNRPYRFYTDIQFVAIVVLNLLMIVLYETNLQQASTIVITYYLQSLCVGLFHFIRLLSQKSYGASKKSKYFPAFFFAIHFNGFHFVYAIFLLTMMDDIPGTVNMSLVGLSLLSVFIGSTSETLRNIKNDRKKDTPNGFLFFLPYVRIIPMHLFLILSFTSFEPTTFLYFLLLKTVADIITYFITTPKKLRTAQ